MTEDPRKLFYDSYSSTLYLYKDKLHKIFKGYVNEELENQIVYNYLIHTNVDKKIILPTGLIFDQKEWLKGYQMDYVDGHTFERAIQNDDLSDEDKIIIINELFRLLENIHNYLIVGDVRNSNLMIGKDGLPYMIDFDFAVKNDSSKVPLARYQLYYQNDYLNDKNGDIVKLFISILSLLYSFDIEKEFHVDANIEYLKNFIPYSGSLKEYYLYFIDRLYHHLPIKEYLKIPVGENVGKDIMIRKRDFFS